MPKPIPVFCRRPGRRPFSVVEEQKNRRLEQLLLNGGAKNCQFSTLDGCRIYRISYGHFLHDFVKICDGKLIPIDLPQEQPDKYLAVEQLMRGYDHIRKQIEDEIKKDAVPRPKRPDLSKYRIVNPSFRRKKRSENTDPETLGRFGSSNSPSSSSKEIEVITIGDDDDDPIRKLDENEKYPPKARLAPEDNIIQRVFLGNFVLAPNHGDIETVTYDDKKLPTFAPERVMFLPKKWRNARVSPELSQSPPTTNIPATKQAEIPVENDEDEESMRHSVLYNIVRSCNSNIPGCATANPAQEELSVEVGDVISELTSLIYNGSPATNDVPEDQGDTSSSSPSALPDYTANDGAFPLLTPENSENLLHLALECCTSTPAFSPNVTSPSSRRQWKSKSCQPTPQKAKSPAKKVKTKWVSKVPPEKRRNRVKKSETPQPQPQENKKEASPKDKNKKRGASEVSVEELQNFVADQAKQIHAHLAALDLPEESYDHEEIQDPAKNSKRPSEERSLTPALIIDEDYVPGDNFDLAPLDRLVYTPIPDIDCPTPRLEKSPVSPKVVVKKKRGRPPGPSRQRAAKKAPILEDESEESQDGSKANRKAKRRYLGQEHNAAKRTRKLTDRDSATPSHVSRSRSPSTSTSSCFKYEDLGAPLILKYDDVSPSTPTARRPNLSSAASVTSSIRQGSYSSAISLLIDEEEQEQKPDREVIVVGPVAAPIVYEEDDDIIFIPQPKEEPEDEIQCIEPAPAQFRQPAPVPKVAPEVASSAPALSNAPDDSTLSLTEFSIKKLIFSFLNDLFTVDPELFCKTVVCLENDKKKEGLVYLMSATLNSRTNQYTEEFMELLANSNQDETYANADWRQYSNYTAEFRSRCSLADIMKDELSPKTFFEIIESIMDIEKQFLEYVASHEEINNDFTKQIVAEAVTSLIARIAASTFQMATLTHIHWAPAEYVRRRLRMIANGWQEFIRKGGLYKIMQFKMRSLEPSAFSEFVDKRLEETDDRLNLAISLLTIPADGLKNKILNEMEVSAEEFEFMVTNTTFDDNKHYSYPCTQCRGLVPRFRDEESLEIHNRLLHSTDCDCHMCFDDFPNKTALTLHILIKHQGDLSAEDE